MICIGLLAGCLIGVALLSEFLRRPAIMPMPEPPLPAELTKLPQTARVKCFGEDPTEVLVNVWELPAVEPGDKNSAYQGYTGEAKGVIKGCEVITVKKAVWSPWSRNWYLFIESSTVQGWVYRGAVEFDERVKSTPDASK